MSSFVRAEWLKLRSLRSTWVLLVLGILAAIGLVVASAIEFGEHGTSTALTERIEVVAGGPSLLGLFVLVLGTQVFTSEFRYHTITSTLVTEPVRTEVLTAKVLTVGIAGLIAGVLAVGASGAAGLWILEVRDFHVPLVDYDVVRPLLGGVLYVGICGVVGVAGGALMRQPALAVAALLAWATVGELTLSEFLPDYVAKYLPFHAGRQLFATTRPADALDYWVGGAVFATWAALLLLGAFAVFSRRDIGG